MYMPLDEKTRRKVAANIRELKMESFQKLAARAGIPFPTLSKVVHLKTKDIELGTMIRIARALGVTLDRMVR